MVFNLARTKWFALFQAALRAKNSALYAQYTLTECKASVLMPNHFRESLNYDGILLLNWYTYAKLIYLLNNSL